MTEDDVIRLVAGRPGVFRLTVAVGRRRFEQVLGYPSATPRRAREAGGR